MRKPRWQGFPGGASGKKKKNTKKTRLSMLEAKETPVDSWVGKIPWRREWLPTPVFWPGESHGQRSLAGYGSQSLTELNTTEAT